MAEARDFKFGMHLGFAENHHKITLRVKSGHGLTLGKLAPINLGFFFNISAIAVLLALA